DLATDPKGQAVVARVEADSPAARCGLQMGDVIKEAGGQSVARAAALGQAAQSHPGRANGAGFFLAMTHWHLGQKGEPRKQYEEAVRWTDKHRPADLELRRFRAEAAGLLENKATDPGVAEARGKGDSFRSPGRVSGSC